MNLAQYLTTGDLSDSSSLALVFGAGPLQALAAAQNSIPEADRLHRISPIKLIDGLWMVRADILPEIREGGLFRRGFSAIDTSVFAAVSVVPLVDVTPLIVDHE
jgi:hypothetical protein